MKNALLKITVLFFFIFALSHSYGQEETVAGKQEQVVIVTMKDGTEYKGTIVSQDNETLVLRTPNGTLNLVSVNVDTIENYDYEGKFEFPNPHDTRYFFGPSGIPVKKGKGYYQNVLLTGNFANYGITKNISVGGGLEFISTVLGNPVWFLTPKVGFDISKNLHAGGGVIVAGLAGEGTASLGYGVFTVGHAETNFTVGAGYGFISGEASQNPAIMLSGTHRVSRSIALLTENYILPMNTGETFYFGIHGIRILSKRNSFDIGAIVIPEIAEDIPALPYVGYVRTF